MWSTSFQISRGCEALGSPKYSQLASLASSWYINLSFLAFPGLPFFLLHLCHIHILRICCNIPQSSITLTPPFRSSNLTAHQSFDFRQPSLSLSPSLGFKSLYLVTPPMGISRWSVPFRADGDRVSDTQLVRLPQR